MEGANEASDDVVLAKDIYKYSLHYSRYTENHAYKSNKSFVSVLTPAYRLSKLVTRSIRAVEKITKLSIS